MKITVLPPPVKVRPDTRPLRCPYCNGPYLARHGTLIKPITDTKFTHVQVERYRCSLCARTFRNYPKGVDRARQSQWLRVLAALMQALGLSCSATSHLLKAQGAGIAPVTVWRDVQVAGLALRRPRSTGPVPVLGADETYVRVRGRTMALGVVTDAQTGETIGIEVLVEQDAAAFLRWLRRYVRPLGVQVLVTDDLSTYKPVAERLGLQHQVCIAHVRKNVTKRLKRLPGQEAVKEEVRALMREFPPWGERALRQFAKALRRHVPWRRFLSELADKWHSLRRFLDNPAVPATNNVTERAIGRSKVRYKTVRGFKSEEGMLNLVALTQWLYTPQPIHDLSRLVN